MKTLEQRGEVEPLGAAPYHSSLRQPAWRWERPLGTSPLPHSWTPVGPMPLPGRAHKALMPIPYREPQNISSRRYAIQHRVELLYEKVPLSCGMLCLL